MSCPECNADLLSNSRKIGFASVFFAGLSSLVMALILAPFLEIKEPLIAAKFIALPIALLYFYLARELGMFTITLIKN